MEEVTKKFQTQYFSPGGGKFRLTKQAKFLGELADNYQQLYLKRGIWTDCLKVRTKTIITCLKSLPSYS